MYVIKLPGDIQCIYYIRPIQAIQPKPSNLICPSQPKSSVQFALLAGDLTGGPLNCQVGQKANLHLRELGGMVRMDVPLSQEHLQTHVANKNGLQRGPLRTTSPF